MATKLDLEEAQAENRDLRAHLEVLSAQVAELETWKRAHLTPVKRRATERHPRGTPGEATYKTDRPGEESPPRKSSSKTDRPGEESPPRRTGKSSSKTDRPGEESPPRRTGKSSSKTDRPGEASPPRRLLPRRLLLEGFFGKYCLLNLMVY